MLMLAIHITLQRMERELYTRGFTHVREHPHQYPRPLSTIERSVQQAFDRLILGDDPPNPINITIPDEAIPA